MNSYTNTIKNGIRRILSGITLASAFMLTAWTAQAQVTVTEVAVDGGEEQNFNSGTIRIRVYLDSEITADTQGSPYILLSNIKNFAGGATEFRAVYAGDGRAQGDADCLFFQYAIQAGDYSTGIELSGTIVMPSGASITTENGTVTSGIALPVGEEDSGSLTDNGYKIKINTFYFEGFVSTITVPESRCKVGKSFSYTVYGGGNLSGNVAFLVSAICDEDAEVQVSDQTGSQKTLSTDGGDVFNATMSDSGTMTITVTPQSEASDVTIRIRPASASGDSSADLTLIMEEVTVNSPAITRIFALSGNATYANVGDTITIGVEFSERITGISGNPLLYLNVQNQNNNQVYAANNTFANYAKSDEANYPHSGKIMYFTYTVKAGDYIADLDATRLALNGATITCSSGRADGTTLASLPKGAATGSLASENNVAIRTIVFADTQLPSRTETIVEDVAQSFIITRGAAVNADQTFSVTAIPANGDKVSFNSSFTIPAGSASAEFIVTAIEATEGTTQKINLHPVGYTVGDTGGDITLEFTITPSPNRPAVKLSGVSTLNEGDAPQYINVALSKAPKENITVTITSSNPNSLPIVDCDLSVGTMQGNTAVMTFPAGLVGPYTITVDPRDGLDAANNSITLHAVADKTYAEYNHIVRVLNVDPTFSETMVGEEGWVLTARSARSPGTISWSAKDVSTVDLTNPLKAEVDFGDGTPPVTVNCTVGGSGSVMHTYMQANLAGYSVRVTVTDKDGGMATIEGNVVVTAPTTALIQEHKRGGNRYNGLAGLGAGSIIDDQGTEREALHGDYDWRMYYNAGCGAVIFLAKPAQFEEDGLTYDSFVHKWIGESFVSENVLDPTLHLGSSLVNVDEDTTAFTVGAVFSREHYPEDNYADIDFDELPDDWEAAIAWGNDSETYPFEANAAPYGRMSNIDNDYLPALVAGIDVDTGDFQYRDKDGNLTTDITLSASFNFLPNGIAFGNVYEVRGTHHGLNAVGSDADVIVDEPHMGSYDDANTFTDTDARKFFGTDPISADTDGDKLSDGFEYFFWRYAKFGGVGEAYNPTAVVTGDEIESAVIEAAFNPCVPGAPTADLDGDGLSNFEEMLLGTNPIDWDTDGDTMNDGWEVMWGLDPFSADDATANPDGDYMADDGQGNIHADVYVTYGFDPRTAWNGIYKERNRQVLGHAAFSTSPNTRDYSNLDEYSLAVWCLEKGVVTEVEPMSTEFMTQPVPYGVRTYRIGKSVTYTESNGAAVGSDGSYSVPKSGSVSGETSYYVVTSTEITTHGSDTDSDGMPDGWELYMSAMPEYDIFTGEWTYTYAMVVWPTSAKDACDPTIDADFDELTSLQECHSTELCEYYSSINTNFAANVNGNWYNKWWPTDIWNIDTDGDRLSDGQEGDETFRYQAEMSLEDLYAKFAGNTMLRGHVPGAGLNPCAVDTDMDYIPDVWEYQFAGVYRDTKWEGGFCNEPGTLIGGGMDGTYFDSRSGIDEFIGRAKAVTNEVIPSVNRNFDFDGDGLENYQEYFIGAVMHFQYDKWEAGKGYGDYDPMQIFSLGEFAQTKELGYYQVKDAWIQLRDVSLTWDWSAYADDWQNAGLSGPELNMGGAPAFPLHYIRAEKRPFNPFAPYLYPDVSSASTDPRMADTDADNMDDYYEMFHGLNPILGEAVDMVNLVDDELQLPGLAVHTNYDFRLRPWLAGAPNADPDQDGLPNWEEALSPNQPAPANYNTDPSPLWFTDISNPKSFVNLYYKWGSVLNYWSPEIKDHPQYDIHPATALMDDMWGGGDFIIATNKPSYIYSFEVNEGFDTDNDNISDRAELTGITNRVTDPQNGDRPALRKAAYLDGKSAFRTRALCAFGPQSLRSWTLEVWVRPEEPATGLRQIILERPVQWTGSDSTPVQELIRRTFRLGLDEYGKPFVEFNNGAQDFITEAAFAGEGAALKAGEWYHLAATMDGYAKKLKLYVNGELVATKSTSVIPYTGFTYSAINGVVDQAGSSKVLSPRWAPIVVGAAEGNALGRIGNEPFYTADGGIISKGLEIPGGQPKLSNFFKGHIDDIRIWTGARPGGEDSTDLRTAKWGWSTIKSDYENLKRYGLTETLEARNDMVKFFGRILNERKLVAEDNLSLNASMTNAVQNANSTNDTGVTTFTLNAEGMTFEEYYNLAQKYVELTGGEDNNVRIPPLLLCSYTFDNLPDPNVEPVLPAKFDAINGRSEDYTGIQWLATATNKTMVYTSEEQPSYIFSHLVENHVASLPLGRLYGVGKDEEYANIRPDSYLGLYRFRPDRSANSKYWTRDTKGGVDLENILGMAEFENNFPNTSNPYRTRYETANHFENEAHPQLTTAVFFDPMHAMLFNDLVPLNNACADMSIQLWDDPMGNGIGAVLDTDGDGLPDWWELAYGLDPYNSDTNGNGILDAYDDFDGDGLNNYYEMLVKADPYSSDSNSNGISDYNERPFGGLTYGELYTDNDHVLDSYEAGQNASFASIYRFDERIDRDLDGWDNWSEAIVGTRLLYNDFNPSISSTNALANVESKAENFPMPTLSATLHFTGDAIIGRQLVIHAYSDAEMNGWPDAVIIKQFTDVKLDTFPITIEFTKNDIVYGHLRQGKNWFFAWVEKDDSKIEGINGGIWPTWTPGEPAAVADYQASGIDIGWDYNPVEFHLAIDACGYVRYSLQQPPNGSATVQAFAADGKEHKVGIMSGGSYMKFVNLKWPRVWVHEGDLQNGRTANYGVDKTDWDPDVPMYYDIYVDNISGGVVTNWFKTALSAPVLNAPVNYEVVYSGRPEFQFYLPEETTEFGIKLTRYADANCTVGAATIYNARHPAPMSDAPASKNMVSWRLPFAVGGPSQDGQTLFSHGYYYKWTVTAYNPANTKGVVSQSGAFKTATVDEQKSHAKTGQIAAKAVYPGNWAYGSGKAPYLYIQAFESAAFNGVPVYTARSDSPSEVGLYGIDVDSSVYLIAFVDQDGDGNRDEWEPYGYYRNPKSTSPFAPIGVKAKMLGNVIPYEIVLRDPDTDNDLIPDSLEYVLYGGEDFLSKSGKSYDEAFRSGLGLTSLSLSAFDGLAADADGDGINDLAEIVYGLGVSTGDTDGDGVSDGDEISLFGSVDAASSEQSLTVTGISLDADGKVVVEWGWDGVAPQDGGRKLASSAKFVTYDIEATDSLTNPDWKVIKTVSATVLDGETSIGTLGESATGARFFRVVFKSVE